MGKPDLVLQSDLSPEQALRRAGWVLKDIGTLTAFDTESRLAKGEVSYLGKVALVDVKVVDKADHVDIQVEAVSLTLSAYVSDSAVKRFADAFRTFDTPQYKPDGTGVSRNVIVAVIVLAIVLQILRWVWHLG